MGGPEEGAQPSGPRGLAAASGFRPRRARTSAKLQPLREKYPKNTVPALRAGSCPARRSAHFSGATGETVTAKLVDTAARDGRRRRVASSRDPIARDPLSPDPQPKRHQHRHLAVWHPSTRAGPCRSGACNCKAVGEENSLGPGRAPPPAGRRRPFCLSQLTEIVVIEREPFAPRDRNQPTIVNSPVRWQRGPTGKSSVVCRRVISWPAA